MIPYILIIVSTMHVPGSVSTQGPRIVTMQEFSSDETCESARNAIAVMAGNVQIKTTCRPK